jgi:hypothetical protein
LLNAGAFAKSVTAIIETPHFLVSRDPSVFSNIQRPGVNLTILERDADPRCGKALEALLGSQRPVRLDMKNPTSSALASAIQDAASLGVSSVQALAEDIAGLAGQFGRVAGTIHPRVRLERVEDDGCALFHADSLPLRMLCTYSGPGMEWLENSNVRRQELGLQSRTLAEANAAIMVDSRKIRRIPAWHVTVFAGRLHSGGETQALVHRSAPVSHSGATRLRLCIDLPGDCGC